MATKINKNQLVIWHLIYRNFDGRCIIPNIIIESPIWDINDEITSNRLKKVLYNAYMDLKFSLDTRYEFNVLDNYWKGIIIEHNNLIYKTNYIELKITPKLEIFINDKKIDEYNVEEILNSIQQQRNDDNNSWHTTAYEDLIEVLTPIIEPKFATDRGTGVQFLFELKNKKLYINNKKENYSYFSFDNIEFICSDYIFEFKKLSKDEENKNPKTYNELLYSLYKGELVDING